MHYPRSSSLQYIFFWSAYNAFCTIQGMKYWTLVKTAGLPSIPSMPHTPGPNDTTPINSQNSRSTKRISGPPESPRHGYIEKMIVFFLLESILQSFIRAVTYISSTFASGAVLWILSIQMKIECFNLITLRNCKAKCYRTFGKDSRLL